MTAGKRRTPAEIDPEGWEIIEALRRALGAELAHNSAAPRLYTRGEGTTDDLPDYVGVPYEPQQKKPPE
jgi:hypothetical protein